MKILKVKTEERRIGNLGERLAARHLKRSGYKILKRNYVLDDAEIDIIAQKGDIIAFVEVKTRSLGRENPNEVRPSSAVTPEKQRKIIKAAKVYYAFTPRDKMQRLDIIEVILDGRRAVEINHMEGAFNANTATKRSMKR